MPRINTDSKEVYGSSDLDQKLTFRERLMKRFAAHEWVRVINPDNEEFRWQYLPAHAEKFEYTPDPMKSTFRDPVESYVLAPGESEVIIGENAYVMIEALYKKMSSKITIRRSPNMEPGMARNFNWTDGAAQEKLIDKIFLGKEKPFNEVTGTPSYKTSPVKKTVKSPQYAVTKGPTVKP